MELYCSSRMFSATLIPCVTYWIPHHFSFTWNSVTHYFLYYIQTFSMGFMSGEFPGHSRTDIPLHSGNFLLLLELWHGASHSYRYSPSVGTQRNVISISCIISLVFRIIHVTFYFSQSFSLLLRAPQTCTLTGDFTVVCTHLA